MVILLGGSQGTTPSPGQLASGDRPSRFFELPIIELQGENYAVNANSRKVRHLAVVLAIAIVAGIGGALITSDAGAQMQRPELPDEVKTWLEVDQRQRWANMIRTGSELFNEGSCVRCHGDGGAGGNNGPDLTDAEWVQGDGSLAAVQDTIFWGVRRADFADPGRRFEMNPQGGMSFDRAELRSIAAYVWSLNNGNFLGGGRGGRRGGS